MEDGNIAYGKDDKTVLASLGSVTCDQPAKLTANGHDLVGEAPTPLDPVRQDSALDEPFKKRVNPLKIHLGKRPFVDNSLQIHSSSKKKPPTLNKLPEPNLVLKNTAPRAPKLIPKKKINRSQFHNVASQAQNFLAHNEQDAPVPRLVPKSQLLQYKKSAAEKAAQAAQMNEHAQNTGLQPMVKFKCRKCCSMSFKTLAMLKEHQQVCRAQAKEPAHSTDPAPHVEATGSGPSRVTRKVYLCSACGKYYENWNLFLHMREVHNRHICLFCLGMFSKAEKLSAHLTNKHNVQEFNYDSKEDFCNVYNGTLYLMCCECDEICSEKDDFFNHDCNNVIPKPVPVLVSKNAAKLNNMKIKNSNEASGNGLTMSTKEAKSICDINKLDKRRLSDQPERVPLIQTTEMASTNVNESVSNERSLSPEKDTHASKNITNTGVALPCDRIQSTSSAVEQSPTQTPQKIIESTENKDLIPNGDESPNSSDRDSPVPMDIEPPICDTPAKPPEPCPPIEKENCGIKIKLSLNKANSPVIINSTVDPTIGKNSAYKPPTRARRPPRRYEKDASLESASPASPAPPAPPKTPSIKMTICDKADSPFVKTTFYDNNQESTLRTLLNNNFESGSLKPIAQKPENTIMSTIYDNKLEEVNTLNRVPKLTVRVPKELLDKDSSSDYSTDSEVSDKLTVDENKTPVEEQSITHTETLPEPNEAPAETDVPVENPSNEHPKEEPTPQSENYLPTTDEVKVEEPLDSQIDVEKIPEEPPVEEIPVIELKLDRPLDKYPLKELLRLFLTSTIYNCIYCNHVRKIAINCEQLSLHMATEHRFAATVDSITAEELLPETISQKVKEDAEELRSVFINLDSYDSEEMCETVHYDHLFECFQCYFKTAIHKDLYLHNRKMHQKTILLCVMCKSNFYSYSELLCHLCPGTYDSDYEMKYRCCLCKIDSIPSSFRLMVHLRKIHNACDVCLEFCQSQAKLSNHVWKHKLHHLCYRCGIAYRNKPDITKHLFWKHGTESVLCKKCLQKKWPHVYHFCTPPAIFVCDECQLQFTKAVCLKVHKRFHSGEFPYSCTEENCTEKFVSKKLLMKHLEEHQRKLATVDLDEKTEKPKHLSDTVATQEPIPIIDLVDDKPTDGETKQPDIKTEAETEQLSKKARKKKLKDKDALLLDVNLPELNLSESDSSDESDSGVSQPAKEEKTDIKPPEDVKPVDEKPVTESTTATDDNKSDFEMTPLKVEEKSEEPTEEKPDQKQVLEIWDNFQKYQAKNEKQREKTPPLVPIKKHVCESDHDYCLIPTDLNGDDDLNKKSNKKKDKRRGEFSSSSSSSSGSDSSCSCRSNCSCSSSSGSSSTSSSDSESSTGPTQLTRNKKKKPRGKKLPNRRASNGSNVDVMGNAETPILIPEKTEPPIAETDLETEESETDEEFYDEHPQKLANKLYAEKRNQLMLLASVAPSDGGSVSGEPSRATTPVKDKPEKKEKQSSTKKKSKKKKRSKSSRKREPIKLNIPKDFISKSEAEIPPSALAPNKITISLQSNTVQIPEAPAAPMIPLTTTPNTAADNKRASKRRRVPNKFYGYSSDEEQNTSQTLALKPQQPPKLEWRKEDLPSPVTNRAKKEVPSTTNVHKMFNQYVEPIRLKTPVVDPEPPRILMNTESMESSDSDSSDSGALEIYQPSSMHNPIPVPPPTYLNSGTSSLPYPFQRPAGRQAREGESVYCYCRCPYDEVSEMIACDADGCAIEWFHFECVGIMVPPKGKWYCPECRKKQSFPGYR